MEFADLVITSDAVFTGTGALPFKGGIAIRGGRIVACGNELHLKPFIGNKTEVRAYGNKLVMPGLIDSHTHFAQGSMTTDPDFCVNLAGCPSFAACMERVMAFAEAHPDNEWVVGIELNQLGWDEPRMPTAADIDAYISDRPVLLQQVELHTYSVNTFALQKMGVTRDTPDPAGGKFLKDDFGEPTGVLSNNAAGAFLQSAYNPPADQAAHSFAKTGRRALSLGITSVGSVNPTFVGLENPYEIFADLSRNGKFPLRMFVYSNLFDLEVMSLGEIKAAYNFPGSTVAWKGLKQFIDGVCSDHTAWMLEPYANAPQTCGEPAEDPERVRRNILAACEAGAPVRLHAIGDRSIRYVLDCFEEARELYGNKGLRHSIEHNETVQPEDLPRYAELGISPAMQPWHILLDMETLAKDDAVGPERAALSWPIKSLVDSGANVHFGSDFPVVGLRPNEEIYGAVYRMLTDGSNPEGWFGEERVSMAEALRAYTYGSAYAMGVEDEIGTLACGKLADVCVFDRNLFEVGPEELLEAKVELTLIGGEVVYEA